MPQGKGTYGSQVGRPPKKKYNKGGSVDPFSTRNPEGVPAQQLAEAMENQNMANEGLPISNAQERSQVSPDTEQYGLGGKIKEKVAEVKEDVRTRVQDVRHRAGEKSEKRKAARKEKKIDKLEKKLHKLKGGKSEPRKVEPKAGKTKEPLAKKAKEPLAKQGKAVGKKGAGSKMHYGAEGRSSLENLITDSVYGAGASKKRYGNKKGKK